MAKQLSSNKEVMKIVRTALKQGWRVEKGGGNHILFYPPGGVEGFVTMSSSPSSTRNFKNALSFLRQKGLKL